jgi:hypothetical protein
MVPPSTQTSGVDYIHFLVNYLILSSAPAGAGGRTKGMNLTQFTLILDEGEDVYVVVGYYTVVDARIAEGFR